MKKLLIILTIYSLPFALFADDDYKDETTNHHRTENDKEYKHVESNNRYEEQKPMPSNSRPSNTIHNQNNGSFLDKKIEETKMNWINKFFDLIN